MTDHIKLHARWVVTLVAYIIMLAAVFALGGCSTVPAKLATWHGSHIESYIAVNGAPIAVVDTPNQQHYTYSTRECRVTITTDINGIILTTRARGIC